MRALLLGLLACGSTGCTSCERVCTPRSQWDLERLADEVDVDCFVFIEDTPLTSLDGFARAESVWRLDVRDNVALSDYDALDGLRGSISITGNRGTDELVVGPVGPSPYVGGNGFRVVDVAIADGDGVFVAEPDLETLRVCATDAARDGIDVDVSRASAPFDLDVVGAPLRCARLGSVEWLARIDDVPAPFLAASHLALIETEVQWRDDPRELYDALVGRGFTGSFEFCPQACARADRDFASCTALCHVFGDVDDACLLVSR